MVKKEYVLGTGQDELSRLGIQHRVWADATTAAWKRAGIGPGTRVLDLGCGPGHASFDLCQLVTETGAVVAFDESQEFVNYLNSQARSRELTQLSAVVGDAQNIVLDQKFDVIYTRWVLCWLKNPLAALQGAARVLKPGGRFVIHDYFNWKIMGVGPRSAAVERMVAAALKSFHERHANMDIAADLPVLLRAAGFRLQHFDIHQRVARGGGVDSALAWPLTWWRTYGPKLVTIGHLSAADCDEALRDLAALEASPDMFFLSAALRVRRGTRVGVRESQSRDHRSHASPNAAHVHLGHRTPRDENSTGEVTDGQVNRGDAEAVTHSTRATSAPICAWWNPAQPKTGPRRSHHLDAILDASCFALNRCARGIFVHAQS